MYTKTQLRLSFLQILQYFVWGVWFVTGGTYMMEGLDFSGREVSWVYANFSIAATVTPLFMGVLADRLFSSERLLACLHLVGGCLMLGATQVTSFPIFNLLILLYVLCYLPTFGLSNALCFHHIEDAKRDFPKVRVWGTLSWIFAGFLVSYLDIEDRVTPMIIAGFTSFGLAAYCLTLPHTPPSPRGKTTLLDSIMGPEIRGLFKDRNFVVLIACIAMICIPLSYYYSFVNPFLNEAGVAHAAAKMSLGQLMEVVLLLLLPYFFRVFRFRTIIFLGLLAWGGRYGLFVLGIETGVEGWLILGLALHGLAYIFSMLSAQIYIDTIVPVHLRSTAQGFFTLLTMGVMALIGTLIAGESVTAYAAADGSHDWAGIWMFPFVTGVLVAMVFLFLFHSRDKA